MQAMLHGFARMGHRAGDAPASCPPQAPYASVFQQACYHKKLVTAQLICVQYCSAALLHLKRSLLALDVESEGVLAHAHSASDLHNLFRAASINAEMHMRSRQSPHACLYVLH